jgi:hypothetical protein
VQLARSLAASLPISWSRFSTRGLRTPEAPLARPAEPLVLEPVAPATAAPAPTRPSVQRAFPLPPGLEALAVGLARLRLPDPLGDVPASIAVTLVSALLLARLYLIRSGLR